MEPLLKRTTKEEQKIALSAISQLENASNALRKSRQKVVHISIQETNEQITIPQKALSLLAVILANMAEGKSITIIPSNSEVSTQQAADMLNVSRPHLVKLLETGKIPFKKVGSHRRIQLQDLMKYEQQLKSDRENQLDFLAKQAQELNLGYE
ncbi:helix-turn-helix domain-containing protein [Rapidithrix thailandica]|uniref:Helix-turn-helix domain-containing protein n=1 Tax=Rapidithrix thailandica TaxID=413964 RepID=A0AAW9S9I4_9BACT